MRRKRPLLFDVLGSDSQDEAKPRKAREPKARKPKAPSPPRERRSSGGPRREIRLSQEFGAVVLAIAVVFVGLSYYLGTLHGGSESVGGRLAREDAVEPRDTAGGGAASAPERLAVVQVMTRTWRTEAEKAQVFQQGARLRDFLLAKEYPSVQVRVNRLRRELVVCVGKSTSTKDLLDLTLRIKNEFYEGRRQFITAYVTLVDAR